MTHPQRRFIFVAYFNGRCGTSAMMELLRACGAAVGPVMTAPSLSNPHGFYEIAEEVHFSNEVWNDHQRPLRFQDQPSAIRRGPMIRECFLTLVDRWFGDAPIVAMKSANYCTVALMADAGYDVRVICMTRDLDKQVNSIIKAWGKPDARQSVRYWMKNWQPYLRAFKKQYPLPYHDVDFKDLMTRPDDVAKEVAAFCGLTAASMEGIIDPTFSRSGY